MVLDRTLQLDSEDRQNICCDPSHQGSSTRSVSSPTWTDIWSVYEDVAKEIEAGAARKHREAEEEKVAARKKAYDECVAKPSAAEQQKVLDR